MTRQKVEPSVVRGAFVSAITEGKIIRLTVDGVTERFFPVGYDSHSGGFTVDLRHVSDSYLDAEVS